MASSSSSSSLFKEETESVVVVEEQQQVKTSFSIAETRSTLQALSSTIHDANSLPSGDSRDVALLTSPTVAQTWDTTVTRISDILNSLLEPPLLSSNQPDNNDSDEEKQEIVKMRVSDTVDASLERAHTALDTVQGFRDTPLTDAESRANAKALSKSKKKKYNDSILGLTTTVPSSYKPQRNFPDYPIDNSHSPFIPPYLSNTNQHVVPVPVVDDDSTSSCSDTSSDTKTTKKKTKSRKKAKSTPHPYQKEISESVIANSAAVFDEDSVLVFRGFDKTTLTFIDTIDGLVDCANTLRNSTEIAVDLEAHSLRSFQGFTCLMQISTRQEDFIIDTLVLRGFIHSTLASIFADPKIKKVMHGAEGDIQWLERDFGIYVVNLFDTGQAAKTLYPLASLSYLLAKFCDVMSPNKKKFQRADWRVRPLSTNMINYARSDTHYLLYIADRLRVELTKVEGKWKEVCEKSGGVCLKRWSKPIYKPFQAMGFASKNGLGFDIMQVCVLQALLKWRDDTARSEDESVMYVCPNFILFDITAAKDEATTPEGVSKILKHKSVPYVRKYKARIAKIIENTRKSDVDDALAKRIKRRLERSVKSKRNSVTSSAVKTLEQKVADVQHSESESSTTTTPSETSDIKCSISTPLPRNRSSSRSSAKSTRSSLPKVKVVGKIASALFAEDSDSASEDMEMEEVVVKVLHGAKSA